MHEALVLILAYLIGSIPVTWLIFYWRTGKDLRTVGDRNVGSGNAIREGAGWLSGHIALLLDTGKGLLAVSIARWLDLDSGWWVAAGFVVMLGHMFPIWLGFRGGRSAATGFGAAGAFLPWQFGLTFLAGTVTFLTTRHAPLGILVVAAPLPFLAIAFHLPGEVIAFCFAAPILAGLKDAFDRWQRIRAWLLASETPAAPPDA